MPKRTNTPPTKSVPAFIARTQFGQLLDRASEDHERFVITKKGLPKVIMLGLDDFLQAVVEPPESLVTLQQQAIAQGSTNLSLEDIEREIAAVRQHKNPRSKNAESRL